MAYDVNIRFGASGETEFRNAIKGIDSQIKNLKSELALATSEMGAMDDAEAAASKQLDILQRSAEAAEAKVAILTDQYDKQRAKLEDLAEALQKAIDENGAGSEEAAKAEAAYNKQATAVNDLGTKLNKAQTDLNNTRGKMDDLTKGTEDAGAAMDKAGEKALSLGDVLKANLASEAIIEGVKQLASGLKELALGAASASDEILSMSKRTGLSTDTLQEFAYMENLVDVSLDTITGSLSKLTKNMASARDGSGSAAEAFKQLGVSVTNSDGSLRSSEDVFGDVIDALGRVKNQTEADALAMNIFGKSAQQLNPLIKAGSEQLAAYAKEAHDVGYVMSEDVLAANGAVDDSMQRLQRSSEAFKNQLGSAMAPVIQDIIEKLSNVLSWLTDNADFITGTVIPVVASLTAGFIAYKTALGAMKIIETVKKFTEGMTIAQAALNAVMAANPVVLVVTALAALIAVLVTAYKTNDKFREKVDAAWGALKDGVASVIDWIKEAVAWVAELPGKALQWGKDLIENFIQGIKDKIEALKEQIKKVAQTVKDFLGFSEPKKGPLSDFHTYAPDMMDLYSQGIYNGIPKLMQAAAAAAGALAGATLGVPTAVDAGIAAGGVVATAAASSAIRQPIIVQSILNGRIIAESIYPDINSIETRKGGNFIDG